MSEHTGPFPSVSSILPHRPPFLFIDRVVELSDDRVVAVRTFQPDEPFFQGHFPDHNTTEDGFETTAPIMSFPPNGYGLYDMAGNVWEWTSDWYRHDYYRTVAASVAVRNPQGPSDSLDPSEPGVQKKVHKGGSYLCTDQYCARFMPGGRGKGAPDTGTSHLGFRLVKDALKTAAIIRGPTA